MKKDGKNSFKGFRKALAYLAIFAMTLGLIEPAFVMKAEAAMSYPVTVNFYDADQATALAPNITNYNYNWTYHAVVSLKDKNTGEVVGWGFANIFDINKATQTVNVTRFWNMDTVTVGGTGWSVERNAWHDFNNGVDFSLADYKTSVRIYYGLKPDHIDDWNCGLSYEDITKQQDTIDGYKFLSQTRNTPPVKTEATATGAVVNIAKDNGTAYKVRMEFAPSAYAFTDADNVYALTTVKHKSGNYTYHYEKLITNASQKTQDITVTEWMDGNGNVQSSEKYSSSEESVSVKLIKVNAGTTPNMNMLLNHTNCYDIADGGDVSGYTVTYEGIDSQFITAAGAERYTTTDYDVIKLTKIQPVADYTYLSVLGNAVNYGVVSDHIIQTGHSETNMATKSYEAGGNNLDPDLSGDGDTQVPGTFLVGEITGSNLRLGGNTPATAIVITSDTSKITDDGSNTSVKVTMPKDEINATVAQMISDIQDVSAEMLTHEATIHPTMVNNKVEIDTTNFPDGVTIYLDGDDYVDAIKQDLGVSIKKNPNQLIVFNFDSTEELTIGKIQVDSGSGYKNTNTETGQFGSEQNTAADLVAQQVVWNMASAKTATTNIAGGIFMMPRTDSTLNLGGTSCGWGISAGLTKLGEGGEFHFVYRKLKQDQTVELAARKLVDNKYPADGQVFQFGIKKYNAATKNFDVVKVTDPDDINVKIPYVLLNNGNTVKFPVTEMTDGENIFQIYEIGKADTTAGAFDCDETVYYAKFNVNVVLVGSTPVKVASAAAYYKNFDAATGTLSGAVSRSNVTFKNTTKLNTFTLKKKVTGDTDSTNPDFTMKLLILDGDQKQVTSDARATRSFTVEGIEGKTKLAFVSGASETFTMKNNGTVVVIFDDLDDSWSVEAVEVTENLSENYTLMTARNDRIDTAAGGEVTLVNEYTAPRGSLTVTKSVTGDTTDSRYDSNKTYKIKIAFDTAGTYKVKVANGAETNVAFTANNAKTYSLKAGESVVVTQIPEGVKYTVTEDDLTAAYTDAGYAKGAIEDQGTGSIVKNTNSDVTVGNTYTVPTGSLSIQKEVTGDTTNVNYDADTEFTVNVQFDESGTYGVKKDGTTTDRAFTADTAISYTLKANETLEISKVPVGVKYIVTESDLTTAQTDAGYAKGSITNNGKGTIVKAGASLVVGNTYSAPKSSLDIVKNVTGDGYDTSKKFQVEVKFGTAGTYKVKVGTAAVKSESFTADTPKTYEIKANEHILITEVPVGVTYTVTEKDLSAADKAAGYANGTIVNGSGSVAIAQTGVTVNNTYTAPVTGSMKIVKQVSGDTAYPSYEAATDYTVNVSFDTAGTYEVVKVDGTKESKVFAADVAEVYTIQAGKSIEISNIPVGVAYTVTEADLSATQIAAGYTKGTVTNGEGTITTAGSLVEIIVGNTYTAPKGKLTVTKSVTLTGSDNGYDADKTYKVGVKFDKAGTYDVTVDGSTKAVAFAAEEVKTYELKSDASVVIDQVPVGVKYTVTEGDLTAADVVAGYAKDSIIGATGAISTTPAAATVKNTYTAPATGSLKVVKSVGGDTTDPNYDDSKQYTVNVSFSKAGTYEVTYNGATSAIGFAEDVAQSYLLKNGASVVIGNIPNGVQYTVTEADLSAEETALGYSKGSISHASGTISATLATATVNNTYTAAETGVLRITKKMTGDTSALNYDATKSYEVKVTFDKSGVYDVKQNGTTTATVFTAGTAQSFGVKAGETVEISKVVTGTNYTVEEADLSAADIAAGYAKGSITNATGSISTTPATATVNNSYTKQTATLTLKKTVINPDGATLPSSYKVAVRDADNRYAQDTTGTFGTAKHYFDVTTGDEGAVNVTGLEIGQIYVIEEDETQAKVSGFDLDVTGDVSVKIKMVSGGKIANVINTYSTVGTGPSKYSVVISKQAEGRTAELAGATLQVKSADGGNYEISWVSNGSIRVLQLAAGKYTLSETEAPNGYAIADPITFEVTTSGSVEIGGTTATSNIVTMVDKLDKFDVNISKKAVGGGDELVNAKLEVKSSDGGSFYEKWISDGTLKTLKLKMGKYTLTETQAPNNYEIAESIDFEVTADGKVIVDGQYVTDNTVIMLDALKKKPISFSKVDVLNSKEIAGAELVLYKMKADNTQEELTSWKSSETEVYTFTLEAGDYAIQETVAPEGYTKAETLVKFRLNFDAEGNPSTEILEGPGEYNAEEDKICFKNDPIKVTGGLTIKVVDEVTEENVPGAVVEVTKPDGSVEEYTTDENGEVTKYKTGTDLGTYRIRVKSVPDDKYTVTINKEQTVEVVKDKVTEAIAKTNTKTGGLTIVVLDKVTGGAVPDATVEVTEPDGSVKTYTTDSNGRVNKYLEKDEQGHYKAALGTYKIRVTKVPDGYSVDTGIVGTETVVVSQVVEHIAKIVTKDDDDDDDEETPANVPTETPVLQEETVTATTKKSLTGGARRTITESAMSLKTGETNVPDYLFGSSLAALFMGAAAYVMSKRKKEK